MTIFLKLGLTINNTSRLFSGAADINNSSRLFSGAADITVAGLI
jgi:hypothetical protein